MRSYYYLFKPATHAQLLLLIQTYEAFAVFTIFSNLPCMEVITVFSNLWHMYSYYYFSYLQRIHSYYYYSNQRRMHSYYFFSNLQHMRNYNYFSNLWRMYIVQLLLLFKPAAHAHCTVIATFQTCSPCAVITSFSNCVFKKGEKDLQNLIGQEINCQNYQLTILPLPNCLKHKNLNCN